MSSFIHRIPLSLLALGVLLCGVFVPKTAWAWAPMCDLTASTVVAPMVAPPVESGEILPCPPALEEDGKARPALHGAVNEDGRAPQPPAESTSSRLDPFPLALHVVNPVSGDDGVSLLLPLAASHAGPRSGFTRGVERPPCR